MTRNRRCGGQPFSFISMNWRGRPLTSHEVIINTIGATTTRAGLKVRARLDEGTYPKGVKIPDRQMRELEKIRLTRDPWHGEWNYTLHPPTTPVIMKRQPKTLIQAEP